ncbi:WD40-repeat-containing domain protein [Scheffersomyces amazonensis]|uniref:WD40-repeat-containing domain protein n=1 Tax=Scheffersomyces amazonensis TaxID=1078765 RepID=UPI00315C7911
MATSPPIPPIERNSYYFSQFPLYCSDWTTSNDIECVALSTYKEGSINKLQVVHGITYESDYKLNQTGQTYSYDDDIVEGYYFNQVAEASVDYPITHLQWDPLLGRSHEQRVAASSEVLRLYKVDYDPMDQDYSLVQTHLLANNTASNSTTSTNGNGTHKDDLNTYPPVTSFDWNHTDPNILITSSVDTTCTVWDLHRSIKIEDGITTSATNTATVKTQLIAHDSEVFDVKFIHDSTNIFASVGNDGSMRVFDLRSLEHSTIIYEPALTPPLSANASTTMAAMNSKALLKLSTSNTDQHHLATVGINSNQVIIIDMRMPGLPVATLDGSLGGINHAAINSIKWHPTSNYLLTGGDDCQALIWDCTNLHQRFPSAGPTTTTGPTTTNSSTANSTADSGVIIETPSFAYEEDLEVNNVCWRGDKGDWLGVVSGKGFQGVQL